MDEAALFATPCTSIQLSEVPDRIFTFTFLLCIAWLLVLTNFNVILVLETCSGFEVLQ
jgi:hypothetical protein